MRLFQRYHYHQIDKFFHTDFWLFETSVWSHVFARSMISIFIPIFLLQMGWAISQVMLFYFIFNIFDAPLNFFAKWLIYKIGARKVIALGTLAYVAFFAILYNLSFGLWTLLILMALLFAIYDTFYWVGHIYFFMRCEKNDRNVSRGVSFLYIARKIAGFLAPIFGVLILIFFDKQFLILASMLILLLSIIPLFRIKDTKDRPDKKPKSFGEFFKKGKGLKEYIIKGVCSFHGVAEGVVWPIFIYTIFKTVESVAAIPVIVAATVVVFTYFTGKIKKSNRRKVMTWGAFLMGMTWILRLSVDSSIFYYISVFLMGVFTILFSLPLESDIYEKGEKKDALSTAAYMNFFSMFPRIFFYGLLYLLLEIFQVSFLLAVVSMFVVVFINYIFAGRKIKNVK
jgi:MFS family permease